MKATALPLVHHSELGPLTAASVETGMDPERIRVIKQTGRMTCHGCGHRVEARIGEQRAYFAHWRETDPPCVYTGGEGRIHLALKDRIVAMFDRARDYAPGDEDWVADVTAEVAGEQGVWRADVLATTARGRKLCVEVQQSRQAIDETLVRTETRGADGTDVLWVHAVPAHDVPAPGWLAVAAPTVAVWFGAPLLLPRTDGGQFWGVQFDDWHVVDGLEQDPSDLRGQHDYLELSTLLSWWVSSGEDITADLWERHGGLAWVPRPIEDAGVLFEHESERVLASVDIARQWQGRQVRDDMTRLTDEVQQATRESAVARREAERAAALARQRDEPWRQTEQRFTGVTCRGCGAPIPQGARFWWQPRPQKPQAGRLCLPCYQRIFG